jgi:hypothetical protein
MLTISSVTMLTAESYSTISRAVPTTLRFGASNNARVLDTILRERNIQNSASVATHLPTQRLWQHQPQLATCWFFDILY